MQRWDDVANSPDAWNIGAAVVIDCDVAAIHGDSELLVSNAIGNWATSDRDQKYIGGELTAIFKRYGHAVAIDLMGFKANAKFKLNAALTESAL